MKKQFILPRYICGIDPDVDKSGFVVYDRQEKNWPYLRCVEMELFEEIALDYKPDEILFVVEAGWQNPGIWQGKDVKGWDPRKAKAYGAAVSRNVYRNHDVGLKQLHFLKVNGYQTEEYPPRGPKWKAPLFMRLTKLRKGYNPEIRDAVRAIWHHIEFNYQLSANQ